VRIEVEALAEEPPAKNSRPRTTSRTARAFREDLSSVDDSIARELLREYGGCIKRSAVDWHTKTKRQAPFFVVELDDLIAVGNAALLEAWVIYRDGDTSRDNTEGRAFGGGFSAHIRRIVYWRIRDYIEGLAQSDQASAQFAETLALDASDEDVETAFYLTELRIWLRAALAQLTVRERAVVVGVTRGDSQAQLGRELGLDRVAVHRCYHRAIEKLRHNAARFGIEMELSTAGEMPEEDEEHQS
jgi:RNA polymerase sigma factor (sigma-70 family)